MDLPSEKESSSPSVELASLTDARTASLSVRNDYLDLVDARTASVLVRDDC